MITHFELLEVTPDCTAQELTEARRRLARELHPDRAGGDAAKMAEVNAACAVLEDNRQRARYLLELRKTHTVCAACKGAGRRWKSKGFTAREAVLCAACKGSGYKEKSK